MPRSRMRYGGSGGGGGGLLSKIIGAAGGNSVVPVQAEGVDEFGEVYNDGPVQYKAAHPFWDAISGGSANALATQYNMQSGLARQSKLLTIQAEKEKLAAQQEFAQQALRDKLINEKEFADYQAQIARENADYDFQAKALLASNTSDLNMQEEAQKQTGRVKMTQLDAIAKAGAIPRESEIDATADAINPGAIKATVAQDKKTVAESDLASDIAQRSLDINKLSGEDLIAIGVAKAKADRIAAEGALDRAPKENENLAFKQTLVPQQSLADLRKASLFNAGGDTLNVLSGEKMTKSDPAVDLMLAKKGIAPQTKTSGSFWNVNKDNPLPGISRRPMMAAPTTNTPPVVTQPPFTNSLPTITTQPSLTPAKSVMDQLLEALSKGRVSIAP